MRGVKRNELISILDFIYQGEVQILQEELTDFLKMADELKLKGMSDKTKTLKPEIQDNL